MDPSPMNGRNSPLHLQLFHPPLHRVQTWNSNGPNSDSPVSPVAGDGKVPVPDSMGSGIFSTTFDVGFSRWWMVFCWSWKLGCCFFAFLFDKNPNKNQQCKTLREFHRSLVLNVFERQLDSNSLLFGIELPKLVQRTKYWKLKIP